MTSRQQVIDLVGLIAGSINAQMVSLIGQLKDYDYLKVTKSQYDRLSKLEEELHSLVKEITGE